MPTPYRQIKIRRGLKADLPTAALIEGEPGWCEDSKELFIGQLSGPALKADGYIAAVPGNWAGLAPTSLSDAIDRLVAEVAILKGGPV